VSPPARILGIETSCDETAAAVVAEGNQVLSSVVSSQVDIHARYGGVVPEIAGRAHVDLLTPVVAEALVEAGLDARGAQDGDGAPGVAAVAATVGPGLVGSLLVGVSAAKSLALVWDVPFVAVNHLEAHLYAAFLEEPDLELPLVVLLVSGGHTLLVAMEDHGRYRLLGQTIDDAAGEAFDKVARFLGLGYPGGPVIDSQATQGRGDAIAFPRALSDESLDFSFSGLKTSVITHVRKHRVGRQGSAGGGSRRRPRAVPRRRGGGQLGPAGADPRRLYRRWPPCLRPQPLDVHRQRGHGGGGRVVAAAQRRSQLARDRGRPRAAAGRRPLSPAPPEPRAR
jgi:tRNA threonylcarbamoyl adenosine modification protein TsaD